MARFGTFKLKDTTKGPAQIEYRGRRRTGYMYNCKLFTVFCPDDSNVPRSYWRAGKLSERTEVHAKLEELYKIARTDNVVLPGSKVVEAPVAIRFEQHRTGTTAVLGQWKGVK